MRNIAPIARRILARFRHDRRTLVVMALAPVTIMWLLSLILTSEEYRPTIATRDLPPTIESLFEDGADLVAAKADPDAQLREGNVDAVITLAGETLDIRLHGADPAKSQAVVKVAGEVMQAYYSALSADNKAAMEKLPPQIRTQLQSLQPAQPAITEVASSQWYGDSDWKAYDYIGPTLVGIFLFVFTFISSQMAMVTERSQGTNERFLASPVQSWQVVAGYAVAFAPHRKPAGADHYGHGYLG